MADPLLSSLCTICRTNPPKYTCPGCRAGTCSLPCHQKHKAWAGCSGRRDPAAFVPAARLKTPAGVDHDYNFLSGIERERDRNQREVVDEKALFTRREVREMDSEKRWRKMWFGEEVHFVAAAAAGDRSRANHHHAARKLGSDGEDEEDEDNGGGGGDGKPSHLARRVRHRLDLAGTQVVHMPVGMSRQRENTTAWNRRTAGINWCVEWIVYEPDEAADRTQKNEASLKKSTHIRHKALDSTPLYKSLGGSVAWHQRGQFKGQDHHDGDDDDNENDDDEMTVSSAYARKRRRVLIREVRDESRRSAVQDPDETTWLPTPYPAQNPYTGAWSATDRAATVRSWLADAEVEARRDHRFYLLRPLTPVGKPKELIPLDGAETLGSALQGRTVLEYPTIYVLPPSSSSSSSCCLPEGHIFGSTKRRAAPPPPQPRRTKAEKRKAAAPAPDSQKHGPAPKRQALGGRHSQQRGGGGGSGRGGRGGARGATRGRGGSNNNRGGGRRQQQRDAAEEGEIISGDDDGDEVHADDTTSSDPDTSSSDEKEEEPRGFHLHPHPRGDDPGRHGRVDIDTPTTTVASAAPMEKAVRFAATQQQPPKKAGLGLVDYGSDSDDDDEDDDDVGQEDVDVTKLNPENPELVANAIREIVGLLS